MQQPPKFDINPELPPAECKILYVTIEYEDVIYLGKTDCEEYETTSHQAEMIYLHKR